jgi:4-hydroxybenzoate polyprenyltransferase
MIFEGDKLATTTVGFLAMSLIASTGYIFNDIHDRQSDLGNPYKSLRPISSGKISLRLARTVMLLSFLSALFLGYEISLHASLLLVFYLGTVISYTLYFKKIAILNTFFWHLFTYLEFSLVASLQIFLYHFGSPCLFLSFFWA